MAAPNPVADIPPPAWVKSGTRVEKTPNPMMAATGISLPTVDSVWMTPPYWVDKMFIANRNAITAMATTFCCPPVMGQKMAA